MAVDVSRSRSHGRDIWEELALPASYQGELVDDRLVVTPRDPARVEPLTTEEWEGVSVPESYRAEIVRSELVVSPAASLAHGRAQVALLLALRPLVPDGYEVLLNMEWRCEGDGLVASAPQPDVIVTPTGVDRLTAPPLLAVEVLSPSDHSRLSGSPLRRIEAKRVDFAANGLQDYVEVDLTAYPPVVIRYEHRDGAMVEVDRAVGQQPLRADRPFAYEIVPADLPTA